MAGALLASGGYSTTKQFTLIIAPAITITSTPPEGVAGSAYTTTFTATGGIGAYTWTVAPGSTLPTGLSLSTSGILSGTPTTAGTYTFSITCTDGSGNQINAKITTVR